MDNALFERLLYEEESPTLDFKRDQYRFAKATDNDKSELLKDILGFVNAWRRSEAYILIGVEDVRGGRANVVGIQAADQLDDHSLQQFVNNLTNEPIRFHYEAFAFENKQLGIIRIEEQPRPIYLKQNYGKLKKNEVYVRRGSSTDPTKAATPQEIAQMGSVIQPHSAELIVVFAQTERDDSLGTNLALTAEFCEMPKQDEIPDLARPRVRNALGIDLSAMEFDPMNRLNPDYFRELATYEFCKRLYRPARFLIENIGAVAAKGVRVEFEIENGIGVNILYPFDLPDVPKRRNKFPYTAAMRHLPNSIHRSPGDITIERNDDRFRIEIECGDLQPGRRIWSDQFSIGKGETGDFQFAGKIFAENLAQPKDISLVASVNVTQTSMSVDDLLDLDAPKDDDDDE